MNMMSRLKRFGYIILWALFGIFIGGWLTYTTVLLWGDQQLSNAYIAIGTLILAAATAILAFLSWRNITSGYDKEKRDRKERWLNEIVEWAQDVIACGSNIGLPVNTKFTTDLVIDNLNKVTFLEYVQLNNRGMYIEAIADEVFTEDLHETIHKIILKLNGVIYIRGKIIDFVEKDEKEPLFDLTGYEREFKTREEVTLVRKIEKELSSDEKNISDLCSEYESTLTELLSTLFTKAAGLKKELIS